MSDSAPQPVPGYRIVRLLGRGAMATVYLAVQESLGREVALKLLAPELAEDPIAAERFIREARTAACLEHRHIVGVHEVGKHGSQPYLSMEYLPGDSVAGGSLPPAQALQVVREIALALDHAHKQSVVHRDVKPDNILRRADGSYALADFGIARSSEPGVKLTQDGMTVGTPHYMSPEQVQGQELDGRSDLYSLGVVLFQLLTGELPYRGTDGWNIGMQHISAPRPTLPAALQRHQPLIDALMAKNPADRPQSGADVARQVEQAIAATVTPATQVSVPAASARNRRGPVLTTVAALALLATGAWYLWPRAEPTPAAPAKAVAAETVIADAPRSIAVLPLVNISGNPENEYFSDGLAETLLDMLAKVPDLTVIARTSSFAFKGKAMDVRKIGKALDATHLLEGSVQQSGQRLRITVQLIRTRDGAHLWSQRYDRQVADVFDVQDEVATQIVKAMELAMPAATDRPLRAGGTNNLEAYREYLRGTALLPMRKVRDMQAAIGHFERAIELDPGFAMAYAIEANTLSLVERDFGISPESTRRRERLISQALQLDPGLGEAYIARATHLRNSDPPAAERDFKRGLTLAPNYATGYLWYSGWLMSHGGGRSADAVPLMQRAIVIDPLDPSLRLSLGFLVLALGRIEEAERIVNKLLLDHPDFALGYDLQAWVYHSRGDLVGELRAIDRRIAADPLSRGAKLERCRAIWRAGAFEKAKSCAHQNASKRDATNVGAEFDAMIASSKGDPAAIHAALARMPVVPAGWAGARALAARLGGKPLEAVAILREHWPEWFKNPIGNPNLDREYDFIEVSQALLAAGDKAQAKRVLRLGLDAVGKRHPGSGFGGGRAWTEAIALALLGQNRKACAAMATATAAGLHEFNEQLAWEPLLADLRSDPCFAPAYAEIQALAKAQIAAAEKAGLL